MKIMRREAGKENNWQYNAMKSVRKQIPKPTHISDDDETYDRRSLEEISSDLPNIHEVISDAETIVKLRGHTPGKWSINSPTSANNYCMVCNKEILVNTDPLHSDLDIDGPATKEDCLTPDMEPDFPVHDHE